MKEYGEEFGVTKKQLDAVLEEASKQDFNKMMKQYIEELDTVTEYSQEEIDSMVKDFTDGMNELLREVESMSDSEIPECVLRIAADDNGYIISLRAAMDISGKAAEASFELRLNPGSVSVLGCQYP